MFDFLKQQQLPDDFDYNKQKKKIGQKRAIGQQLNDFRFGGQFNLMQGGQVSGGMTSPLSTLATIATNLAGAKLLANSMKEEEELDAASDKLYRDGIKALKDVRDKPTDEEKWQAQKVADVGAFAADPLVPYGEDAPAVPQAPQPVEQPAPAKAPKGKVQKSGGKVLRQSTGSGRGEQGGPSAQELIDYRNQQIDEQNLQDPMKIYRENGPARIPGTFGYQARENVGIDEIGSSGMTPQQIERQVKPAAVPGAVQSVVPPAVAAQQAAEVGGGRGGQGGPGFGQSVPTVSEQLARMEEQARQRKANEDLAANQQFMGEYAEKQGRVLRQSLDNRKEQARQMLIRSGEKGRKLVDQMDMAELGPEDDRKNFMVVGDRLYNTKTNRFVADASRPTVYKEGDYIDQGGQLVRVGGQTGRKPVHREPVAGGLQVYYDDGSTELIRGRTAEGDKVAAEGKVEQAARDKVIQTSQRLAATINQIIASGDVEQAAAGMLNRGSALLNKTLGMSTDTAAARSRIDAAKSQIAGQIMADFQASGLSANKLADTKRELELHIASAGNFDYERLDAAALKAELARFADEAIRKATTAAGLNTPVSSGGTPSRSPGGRAW